MGQCGCGSYRVGADAPRVFIEDVSSEIRYEEISAVVGTYELSVSIRNFGSTPAFDVRPAITWTQHCIGTEDVTLNLIDIPSCAPGPQQGETYPNTFEWRIRQTRFDSVSEQEFSKITFNVAIEYWNPVNDQRCATGAEYEVDIESGEPYRLSQTAT